MEYDLSCIIEKDDISFSGNMILHPRLKMKDGLSQKKVHRNMIFSSRFLKKWSFEKGLSWDMISLVLSENGIFFPENRTFFP